MNKSLPPGSTLEGELIARRERARFAARKQLQERPMSGLDWAYLMYALVGMALGWLVSEGTAPQWVGGISTFGVWMAAGAYRECAILRKRQEAMLTLLLEPQRD